MADYDPVEVVNAVFDPEGGADPKVITLYVCHLCSSLVSDTAVHDAWHIEVATGV